MSKKLLYLHLFFACLLVIFVSPVSAEWIPPKDKQDGGPVVLLGIDAEDAYGTRPASRLFRRL